MSLRSWTRAAHVLGTDLHAYLAQRSAADAPRDSVHLRTQELVARTAGAGAWRSIPEFAIDDAARGTRSLDLWLERRDARGQGIEVVAIEVMDWFDDVGARFRDWDRRLERVRQLAIATRTVDGDDGFVSPRVSGCWVVRATTRNRQLLHEHATLFDARFPGSGRHWLDALTSSVEMPAELAILWVSVDGSRLFPRQRTSRASTPAAPTSRADPAPRPRPPRPRAPNGSRCSADRGCDLDDALPSDVPTPGPSAGDETISIGSADPERCRRRRLNCTIPHADQASDQHFTG